MSKRKWFTVVPLVGMLAAAPTLAADLNFDFKVSQGSIGTTFAILSLNELAHGTTTFTLNTALSGGSGNPGIVELQFGCNGCGTPIIIPGLGVSIGPGGTQAGYAFDYRVAFDPWAIEGNTPLTWTAASAPGTFLESTAGAGPNAFAMIRLTGGAEIIDGQNVTSGFYVAAVPEPSRYALMLAGLAIVGVLAHKRRPSSPFRFAAAASSLRLSGDGWRKAATPPRRASIKSLAQDVCEPNR